MTTLTVIGSLLRIPIYPVPASLQSIFPLLAGAIFPPSAAAATQGAYLILGLLGLPIFSQGGGIGYILQPSFGYLLAMPLTAAIVAWGMNRLDRPPKLLSLGILMAAGTAVLLVFGTVWLYFSFNWILGKPLPFIKAIGTGLILFIPIEILKLGLAILTGRKFHHLFH